MHKEKNRSSLTFIFITLLVDVIGIAVIIPVLPHLIEKLIHKDIVHASVIGMALISVYAFMQFVCSPIIGGLSDRFGRRPVILASLVGMGIDYLIMALAPNIIWLFVGRALAGIAGASITSATAYIADVSTEEDSAKNFGLIGVAFGLGFVIGPVIGGYFAHYGLRVPFYVASAMALINAAYGFFVLPESLKKENRRALDWSRANPIGSLQQLKKYHNVFKLILSLVLVYLGAHAVQTTWTYYTMYKFGWNERMVGWSLGAVGILVMLVQGVLIGKLSNFWTRKQMILYGLALYAVGMVLFGIASQGWMMFAFLPVYCMGGIAGPSLQSLISGQVPKNAQGELQGGLTSLMSITSFVGPLIMNGLFGYFSGADAPVHLPGAPYFLAAVLFILSIVLTKRCFRQMK